MEMAIYIFSSILGGGGFRGTGLVCTCSVRLHINDEQKTHVLDFKTLPLSISTAVEGAQQLFLSSNDISTQTGTGCHQVTLNATGGQHTLLPL